MTTPPPPDTAPRPTPLTPSQLSAIEEKRLRALDVRAARVAQRQREGEPQRGEGGEGGREVSQIDTQTRSQPPGVLRSDAAGAATGTANSTSTHHTPPAHPTPAPAAPPTPSPNPAPPRPNASRRSKRQYMSYYEYNFTEMVDTKGGFLVESDLGGGGGEASGLPAGAGVAGSSATSAVDDALALHAAKRARLMDREVVDDPPIQLPLSENPRCRDCGSLELDKIIQRFFHLNVCRNCKKAKPEKYSLLTKTECREDYLLTESELRDSEKLPTWEKPNPHKNTWSNMFLYLREQVEAFAWEKWGSEENLDREFERRDAQKKTKKEQVFTQKLNDLRKKTRTATWARNLAESSRHDHVYGPPREDGKRECSVCGLAVEIITF
ncbi:hypothetical protein HDU93_007299 [Gonapodya sp. JEL0774]|nr:hypothetical protein HDU93_007299 [Gonapodya sp. JEL0774]